MRAVLLALTLLLVACEPYPTYRVTCGQDVYHHMLNDQRLNGRPYFSVGMVSVYVYDGNGNMVAQYVGGCKIEREV